MDRRGPRWGQGGELGADPKREVIAVNQGLGFFVSEMGRPALLCPWEANCEGRFADQSFPRGSWGYQPWPGAQVKQLLKGF